MGCSICGKRLSAYNPTDKCWAHNESPDTDYEKEHAMLMVGAGTLTDTPFIRTQMEYQGSGLYAK